MAKGIKRKLDRVYENVEKSMYQHVDRNDKYGRGLATEGYAGGYRDALMDVMAALEGFIPERNGWWEEPKTSSKADRR